MTFNIVRPGHNYTTEPNALSHDTVSDVLESAARHSEDRRVFRIVRVTREWERTFSGWQPITVFAVKTTD